MTILSVHAGHGGKKNGSAWTDPGAVGSGYKEADVARTITDLMVKKTGAKNVTDNTSTTSNGIINNVAANINKCADGWQISNHLNAFNGSATGVEVLYGSAANKEMAAKVSAAIAKTLGLVDRGAKDGTWLGIARNSGAGKKVLLIEWGFIDNASDMKILFAKMDEAVNAALAVFGYNATQNNTTNDTSNKVIQELITQGSAAKISGLGYRLHVQSKSPYKAGTLGYVKEGETAGTTGKGLRAEWLEVLYDGKGSPFEIDTHVQKKGWLGYRKGSQGTKGESLRMEAVRIRIADAALAKTHSIMYRVHSQTYGWGAWVKDGAISGTTGKSKRMEAIQIKLVKK